MRDGVLHSGVERHGDIGRRRRRAQLEDLPRALVQEAPSVEEVAAVDLHRLRRDFARTQDLLPVGVESQILGAEVLDIPVGEGDRDATQRAREDGGDADHAQQQGGREGKDDSRHHGVLQCTKMVDLLRTMGSALATCFRFSIQRLYDPRNPSVEVPCA